MKTNKLQIMQMFCTLLLVLFALTGVTQQPSGTINVVTDAGASGNGSSDDTQEINSAISMAYSQNNDVYFPPGTYSINGTILVPNGVSLYGDHSGLSVLTSSNNTTLIGDQTLSTTISNINIEDLHFHNAGIWFKNPTKQNYNIRRCIFFTANNSTTSTTGDDHQVIWNHIINGLIEDCIFMRQADSWGRGISTYKTQTSSIKGNIFGLDINNASWLSSEWPGYSSWYNLISKISTLRSNFGLDSDQGYFKTAINPNEDQYMEIYDNLFNGSPNDNAAVNQDHVIYSKKCTDLEIVGNWMRGWPVDAAGGLKVRNTYGPVTIAANHFVNTPILAYSYANTTPIAFQNVLYYRNWFDMTEGFSFNRIGLSYWEDTGVGDDVNIEYDNNIYNVSPGVGDIHLGTGSDLNEHKVYPTNYYAGTSTLIPIYPAGTSYASGSPDPSRTSPFSSYPIWNPNVPEYGTSGGDTQAPTTPTGLTYSNVTTTSVLLSWNASSDNIGVIGYDIYQGSSIVGSPSGTSYTVTGLTANTTYSFSIRAKDASGNVSASSNSINVTTQGICCGCITSFPYTESFENSFGIWNQETSDDADWTRQSGSTPSSGTGPTTADDGSFYLYIESSSPYYPSNTANLILSGCFDLSSLSNPTFDFSYHMYGSAMGTLNLQASLNGTTWTTIWSLSGDQGNSWQIASISLASYAGQANVQFRFNGTTGSSYTSDMSIDMIIVGSGGIQTDTQAPSVPTGLSGNPTTTSVALSWNASSDNVGVTGYDVYQGSNIAGSSGATSFNVTGLNPNTSYSFSVRAKDAAGNVSAQSNALNVTTPSPSSCIDYFPYTESFESNFGVWNQETGDDTDWTRQSGSTPSSSTGPTAAADGSYYAYIESSSPYYPSNTANLVSDCFDFSSLSNPIFDFSFHMYGSAMGTLNLQASTNGSTWTTIWSLTGNQGNSWQTASVSLASYSGQNSVQFRFNGTTGSSYTSDMSVDMITIGGGNPTDTQTPSIPTGLSGNPATTSVALSWNASTDNVGVTGYDIFQSGSNVGTATGTSFTVTGLNPNTTYNFSVRAKDAAGNVSAQSSSISVTTLQGSDTQAPSTPSGLTYFNVTQTSVSLSWNASSDNVGVTGYDVFQGSNIVGSPSNTSFSITGLSANTYTFRVRAKDAAGNVSSQSNPITVIISGPTTCISSFPYSESFESSFGVWSQETGDDTDWTRQSGSTPSSSTGPTAADDGSYYAYIESSSPYYPSNTANLVSDCFDFSNLSNPTFDFSFHMYGSAMGTLNLQASTNGSSWTTIWSLNGDQGNSWQTASVSLASYAGQSSVQFRFNGTTGSSYTSDISVDMITIGGGNPTDTQAPSIPTGLSGNPATTSVALSWNASTDNVGVTGYDISQSGSNVGTSSGTSFTVTGLNSNTTYSFSVRARDAAGNTSSQSSSINVTTQQGSDTQAPSTPSNLTAFNPSNNSIDLSWNASSDNVGVTGYDVYRGSSNIGTTGSTSYTTTGLSQNTSYTFTVRARDAAGNVSSASNSASETTTGGTVTYCTASSASTAYEYISRVQLGSIDQSSSNTAYSDYTSVSTNLNIGSSSTISITTAGNYSSDEIVVYIDYNHDGDFADSGEEVYVTTASTAQTYSGSISVPSSASSGSTRMRIVLFDTGYNSRSSCGSFSYGEVEDYTVNFGAVGPSYPTKTSPIGIIIRPNPNNGKFELDIVSEINGKLLVNIYNASGQLVVQKSTSKVANITTIPMNLNLTSGFYSLQIILEEANKTEQFIIE